MIATARKLLRHRGLLATLVERELKGRYRGSVLGFLWSLVQPLLLLAVYSFVFGHVFQPRTEGAEPYPLFLVCGLFPWIWFSSALAESTVALVANSGLIRRAVFPAELLPVVPVLSNLVHLLLALPVLALGLAIGRAQGFAVGGWGALAVPVFRAWVACCVEHVKRCGADSVVRVVHVSGATGAGNSHTVGQGGDFCASFCNGVVPFDPLELAAFELAFDAGLGELGQARSGESAGQPVLALRYEQLFGLLR